VRGLVLDIKEGVRITRRRPLGNAQTAAMAKKLSTFARQKNESDAFLAAIICTLVSYEHNLNN
jgi:hypothetical protein